MATVANTFRTRKGIPGDRPEPLPVIADSGDDVCVVLVRFATPPAVGDRFTLNGTTWEVVRLRDHVRGCVARPVLAPAS